MGYPIRNRQKIRGGGEEGSVIVVVPYDDGRAGLITPWEVISQGTHVLMSVGGPPVGQE